MRSSFIKEEIGGDGVKMRNSAKYGNANVLSLVVPSN